MKVTLTFDEVCRLVARGLRAERNIELAFDSNDAGDYAVLYDKGGDAVMDYGDTMLEFDVSGIDGICND